MVWATHLDSRGMLLAKELGIQPVAQVTASAVFFPNISGTPATSMEVSGVSRLRTDGWNAVLDRLHKAATDKGADGVLGLALMERSIDQVSGLVEFAAVGTAVTDTTSREFFLSFLSPSESLLLRRAGLRELGIAFGCCAWHQVAWRYKPKQTGPLGTWANQEMPELSQGPYQAREIAMERMSEMARALGGRGIVGVRTHTRMSHGIVTLASTSEVTCEFDAYGTVVGELGHSPLPIRPVLGLER